jgi:hypothetical protein
MFCWCNFGLRSWREAGPEEEHKTGSRLDDRRCRPTGLSFWTSPVNCWKDFEWDRHGCVALILALIFFLGDPNNLMDSWLFFVSGCINSTAPVLQAEISPKATRGQCEPSWVSLQSLMIFPSLIANSYFPQMHALNFPLSISEYFSATG